MIGRYELKYVITPEQREKIIEAAGDSLVPDPHGVNAIYRVASLYFDTPRYCSYWERMDGQAVRRKYRLRYYSATDDDRAEKFKLGASFMEIKHRVDNTLYKQRVGLTADGALAALTDARELRSLHRLVDDRYAHERATILDIEQSAIKLNLNAAAVITYLREAWLSEVDNRFRLTFDTNAQVYPAAAFSLVDQNHGAYFLPPNRMIMEVKFNHAIPRWIRDIITSQGLRLQRFSKYASGLETHTNLMKEVALCK